MRQSVLASVLEVAASNLRNTDDVRLFEIGFAYLPKPQVSQEPRVAADEPRRLAIVMTGNRSQEFWSDGGAKDKQPLDFFDLKGVDRSPGGGFAPEQSDVSPGKGRVPASRQIREPCSASRWREPPVDRRVRPTASEGRAKPTVSASDTVLVAEFDVEAMQTGDADPLQLHAGAALPGRLARHRRRRGRSDSRRAHRSEIRRRRRPACAACACSISIAATRFRPAPRAWRTRCRIRPTTARWPTRRSTRRHKKIEDRLKQVLKAAIRGKE